MLVAHAASLPAPPEKSRLNQLFLKAIYHFLDSHPEVTRCFYVTLSEIFLPMLVQQAKRLLLGKRVVPVSGIWVAINLFYQRKLNLVKELKFAMFIVCVTLLLLRSRSQKILFTSEGLTAVFQRWARLAGQVSWCPEPIVSSVQAVEGKELKSAISIPSILFAGVHRAEKNTHWALEALLGWATPLKIVVAGKVDDDVPLAEIGARFRFPVVCEIHDRWVSPEEMVEFFESSSVVVLSYRNHGGSSSVLVNALLCRRPVLVTDYGMIAEQVRQLGCGGTFLPGDTRDFREQISRLLKTHLTFEGNTLVDEFLARSTPQKFYEKIMEAMAESNFTQKSPACRRRQAEEG